MIFVVSFVWPTLYLEHLPRTDWLYIWNADKSFYHVTQFYPYYTALYSFILKDLYYLSTALCSIKFDLFLMSCNEHSRLLASQLHIRPLTISNSIVCIDTLGIY